MTTPAVNRDIVRMVDGYRYTIYNDGEVQSVSSPQQMSRFRQVRPASVNGPVAGTFRYPTGWLHEWSRVVWPLLSFRENAYWWGYTYYTNDAFASKGVPVIRPTSTSVENRAVNAALKQLKGSKVDLSVAFLERQKTKKLFTDVVEEVAGRTRDFRRKNGSTWDKVRTLNPRLESYPKKWLAFQYGVKPLVQDLYGSLSLLNEIEQGWRPFRASFRGRAEDTWTGENRTLYLAFGHPEYPLVFQTEDVQRDHVSLTYAMDTPVISVLSAAGITNPLNTAWELAPYSFVVDWAAPVGDYLSLLDADFGWSFVTGSHSTKMVSRGRGLYVVPPYSGSVEGDSSRARYELGSFHRYIYNTSPWPRMPPLENPLKSAGRVANAFSLLVSAYR